MPPLPFDSPDDAWPVIRAIMRLDSLRLRNRCDGSGMAIRWPRKHCLHEWLVWPSTGKRAQMDFLATGGSVHTAAVGQNQGVRIRIGYTAELMAFQTAKIMIGTASLSDLREHLTAIVHALEQENAIMLARHSRPAAYLLSSPLFASLLESLERLEDQADTEKALAD